MASDTRVVTITDEATRLDTVAENAQRSNQAISIKNVGAATVELGEADVTFGTGYPLDPGEHHSEDLEYGVGLYAVADTGGSVEVRVRELGI